MHEYEALPVQQQPAGPTMYLLSAAASELLEWADVPNAKADYMAGYQRVYDANRAANIRDFLTQDPQNIIPGAIIVTLSEESYEVVDDDCGSLQRIRIHPNENAFEEKLERVFEVFRSRLSDAEKATLGLDAFDDDDMTEEEVGLDESEEDAGIPESYIASLTAELKTAREEPSELPPGRLDAIKSYVESVSKPGLIIDGQHRVFGAKDVNAFDVRLPIVLLPGLLTREQVFHFYVLNNKARPLSATELRRTISTSLTNAEIDSLWERFEKAGVNPEAVRWTHKMNTDSSSPFQNLVDNGLGGGGFIKENVAYQLVVKFVGMGRKYRILYKDLPQWQKGGDERLPYFYAFWGAIRERYQDAWDEGVSNGGNQLFYKAAMLVLQELLLDQLVQWQNVRATEGKASPFADVDDLKTIVKASLKDLPSKFFTDEWQQKQIDTTQGRKFLREQMQTAITNQGKYLGNLTLFRAGSVGV